MSRKKKRRTPRPPDKPKETLPEKNYAVFFDRYGLWIALLIVSGILFIVFRDFILARYYYLFKDIGSDSINSAYPLYVSLTNYLKTDGFPMWSFQEGMGQNIMALTNNRDPFSWMVYLGSVENIMYRIIWLELLKIVLTALAFYYFLKIWGLSIYTRLIGTVLYCFSGFMIIGGGWTVFSAEACLLALLLLGFELVYQYRSWYLFPVAVMLIAFRPFNLYFYCLFLLLYFVVRHLIAEDHSWKRFLNTSVRLVFFGLLGIAMGSLFFVSSLQLMLDSPRVGGGSSYMGELISNPVFFLEEPDFYATAVLRLFSNDLLGNGSEFKGWYNYLEAPMFYIGLLPLLMAPQLFSFAEKRRKMIFGIFMLLFIVPVVFPFFRYAVWAFQGDYFRGYSIFLSLAILIPALLSVEHLINSGKINLPLLAGTMALLITLLFLPYPGITGKIQSGLRMTIVLFLVIYFLIVMIAGMNKYKRFAIPILLLLVIFEAAYMNRATIMGREVLGRDETSQKAGYNDYTVEAMEFIHKTEKGFFRVNKDYFSGPAVHASINDAKVQGYYGTMNYSSFNQKYYIRFLEHMGLIDSTNEYNSRWAFGLMYNPLLLNFASTKYQLIKNSALIDKFRGYGFLPVAKFGDVTVMKNTNFLPLGISYDKYIPLGTFLDASMRKKVQLLNQACVVEEPVDQTLIHLLPFDLKDTISSYGFPEYKLDCVSLREDTLSITMFSQNSIRGHIDPDKFKMLFFSIPYDKGWRAKIDGEEVRPVLCNIGFMGLVIPPGSHSIELNYLPPYFTISLVFSVLGILVYLGLMFKHRLSRRKAVAASHS